MSVEKATFAAGCFWGVEWVFRQVPGVFDAISGYTGGSTPNPTYRDVCSHTTGHAEAVEVTFDDEVVTFDQLLEVFWAMHDPTQVNRQGPDIGDQYRSAVFVHSPEQRTSAEASKARAQQRFSRPIATQIVDATTFYQAEDYHQRYYASNGHTPYCHVLPKGLLEELGLVKV
jgi:peptide-methionine (S)-S-oxide reductase